MQKSNQSTEKQRISDPFLLNTSPTSMIEINKEKYSAKYFPSDIRNYTQDGQVLYFYATDTVLEVKIFSYKIVRFS